jgi:hypothetical protein
MNRPVLWTALRTGALLCLVSPAPTAVFAQSRNTVAQSPKPVISLVSETPNAASEATLVNGEVSFANAPASFHRFASARVGEDTYPEQLTLRFAASTRLTEIKSTKDFQVEQGSSCIEEGFYSAGETCVLLVRFTPQGPGARLGKLTITHTASAQPFSIGLGGFGYAPVVSFNPALISTVPGSFPSGKGLLTSALNLTVDGGDSLYIADTGNNAIWYMDSSGKITNLTAGYSINGPLGIAVDNFGEVYFSEPSANAMYEIFDYGLLVHINGSGTASCPYTSPCTLTSEAVLYPGQMSMDPYNHLFFEEGKMGAAMSTVLPYPPTFAELFDPFTYQKLPYGSDAFTIDANDNLYSLWANGYDCAIIMQVLSNAETATQTYAKVVGGRTCGFSGDGAESGNAEIGSVVGQMVFDIAGNLYFSDTSNQRVRRVEAVTGIINTIAGTGTAGYTGDGGAATSADLSFPTGVGVDSQGQVYIISGAAATGTAQVIRKLGPNGFLQFGGQLKGTTSSGLQVVLSNAGNSTLTLTNIAFTGADPGDFAVDPTTTSCLLTAGATLYAGQSCTVGILFKPSAGGSRTASLVLLDNTVTNSNTIQLAGTGTLPAPTFTITSPASGTSVSSGTTVKFAVSVTSSSSPAPTGTVVFKVDSTGLGSVALSSGTASVDVTETTTGSHTLSASYSGDANYAPAGPITRTYTVTSAATAKLASSANPATNCEPVTFTITVTGEDDTKPTGKVLLMKGSTVLATATLSEGEAKVSTSALTVGKNVLNARYEGNAKYSAATSEPLTQMIMGGCEQAEPQTPHE